MKVYKRIIMSEKNTELVQVKIKPSVKEAAEQKAESLGHKLASYLRFLIEKDVKKK